jgi:hypothetical protein
VCCFKGNTFDPHPAKRYSHGNKDQKSNMCIDEKIHLGLAEAGDCIVGFRRLASTCPKLDA